jgi:hypothetical protein
LNRTILPGLAALVVLVFAACEDDLPTSLDPDLFPVAPRSVELRLPWSSFAGNLRVIGGYGAPIELFHGILANDFEGTLDSRTLVRFADFPDTAFVLVEGSNVRSALSFTGGRVVARFDTVTSVHEGPVEVVANQLLSEWYPPSATWTVAVDTINDTRTWPVPGGGPVRELATGEWDPESGDSLVLEVDSAAVASWGDTTDLARGLRLDVVDAGVRLRVNSVTLRLDAVPEVRTDTTIVQTSTPDALGFIYDPVPEPPPDGMRIGGAPAWRTIIDVDVPAVLEGPESVCQRVECPFTLEPERINAASLILKSRASPAAFQPTDTIRLDVRAVLSPDRLPKSPLGESFVGSPGRPVAPSAFGEDAGTEIAIPVTGFVRDIVRGETSLGEEPPGTMALLSFFEPLSISFASFAGPGGADEPYLRLIVTLSDTVDVR